MKVLLACQDGGVSHVLENHLNDFLKEKLVKNEVVAHGLIESKSLIDEYDVVLISPQSDFMLDEFKHLSKKTPVGVIAPGDFAKVDIMNIYNLIIKLIKNKENK